MQAIKMFIYRIFECIKPKITNRGDFLELSRTQLMELQKADIEQTDREKLYDVIAFATIIRKIIGKTG